MDTTFVAFLGKFGFETKCETPDSGAYGCSSQLAFPRGLMDKASVS